MKSKSPHKDVARPWMLGCYAVYAQNLHAARQAYEQARSQSDPAPFGTIELESGEKIEWINMTYGAIRQRQGE